MSRGLISNAFIIKRRLETLGRLLRLIVSTLKHIPKLVVVLLVSILASRRDLVIARLLASIYFVAKLYCNHALNPNPFIYTPYCSKRPSYIDALELASNLYRVVV
jgi:hypothetical protein